MNKLQDFTAFAERHETQRIHISPQLTLATFQFLSTSELPTRVGIIGVFAYPTRDTTIFELGILCLKGFFAYPTRDNPDKRNVCLPTRDATIIALGITVVFAYPTRHFGVRSQ